MRHLMCDFTRRAAREAGDYREHPGDEPDYKIFINPDEVRAELGTLLHCTEKRGPGSQATY